MPNKEEAERIEKNDTALEEPTNVEQVGPNALKVTCDIEGYEGYIVIPKQLDGRTFNHLWKELQKQDDPEEGHWIFTAWRMIYPMVTEWHITGIDTKKHLEPTGLDFPNMAVMSFVVNACNHLLDTALSLGNLR